MINGKHGAWKTVPGELLDKECEMIILSRQVHGISKRMQCSVNTVWESRGILVSEEN